jgi:prefoldin subunit 5
MPGKLDEISQAIGALQAGIGALATGMERIETSIADNRTLQSTRHGENRRDIEALQREVQRLQTLVAALQLGRGKLALLAGVGFIALTVFVWAIEAGFQWFIGHVLKMKFGG